MQRTHLSISTRVALAALAGSVALGASAQASNTQPNDGNATAATQPAAAQKKASETEFRDLRASQLIGMSVQSTTQGDNIGQIGDMIVDLNTGDVRYAIVRFDPGVFATEKLYAVPTTALRIGPERNNAILDIREKRLDRASFDRSTWSEQVVAAPGFLEKLDAEWGVRQPSHGSRAHRMSDLLDKDVNRPGGEEIGEIEDIIVNMAAQKVHYAVLEFDPGWSSVERDFAVPLTAFDLGAGRDELVLKLDKAAIAKLKNFPDSRYANLNDPAWIVDIDRYLVTVSPVASADTTDASNE